MDVARFEAGQVSGKTDADGAYRFDLRLPSYFAGRALTQGAARVLIEATVKDSAGHAETRGEPVTVSESPLLITAVPEGGTMAPHLENQVFVLTSYADGDAGGCGCDGARAGECGPEGEDGCGRGGGGPGEGRGTAFGWRRATRRATGSRRRCRCNRGRARTRFCCARSGRCIARARRCGCTSFRRSRAGRCTWTS